MMTLETTAQFRRDYKRVKKRGYNMELLVRSLTPCSQAFRLNRASGIIS